MLWINLREPQIKVVVISEQFVLIFTDKSYISSFCTLWLKNVSRTRCPVALLVVHTDDSAGRISWTLRCQLANLINADKKTFNTYWTLNYAHHHKVPFSLTWLRCIGCQDGECLHKLPVACASLMFDWQIHIAVLWSPYFATDMDTQRAA